MCEEASTSVFPIVCWINSWHSILYSLLTCNVHGRASFLVLSSFVVINIDIAGLVSCTLLFFSSLVSLVSLCTEEALLAVSLTQKLFSNDSFVELLQFVPISIEKNITTDQSLYFLVLSIVKLVQLNLELYRSWVKKKGWAPTHCYSMFCIYEFAHNLYRLRIQPYTLAKIFYTVTIDVELYQQIHCYSIITYSTETQAL